MKLFNKYIFFARYLPGLITLLPASLIYFFITKEHTQYELTEYFLTMPFFCGVSVTFVITYFVSMATRELGSFLEMRYFHKKMGFPSTYNLLWSDTKLSRQDKQQYAQKIKADFNLELLSEQDESNDPGEAIKVLCQVSRLLSTKYQRNEQAMDANIAYGFSRNVSGGLLISLPIAVAGTITGLILHIPTMTIWLSCLTILFIFIAIFHKMWMMRNAEKYAEKIFSLFFQR